MLGLAKIGGNLVGKAVSFAKGSGIFQKGGLKKLSQGGNKGIFGGKLKNIIRNVADKKEAGLMPISSQSQSESGETPLRSGVKVNASYSETKPSFFKNADGTLKVGLIVGFVAGIGVLITGLIFMLKPKKGARR